MERKKFVPVDAPIGQKPKKKKRKKSFSKPKDQNEKSSREGKKEWGLDELISRCQMPEDFRNVILIYWLILAQPG